MILITLPDGTAITLDIGLVVTFGVSALAAFFFGLNWVLKRRLNKD